MLLYQQVQNKRVVTNSTPRGAMVIEKKPGEWHTVIAHQEGDYDFSGGHTVFGPFKTEDAAFGAFDKVSNPGGFNVVKHKDVTKYHHDLIKSGRRWANQYGSGGY
jgi:hypothetical protein